ncbi:MAG TPA: EpsI family protein [Bryobacteraceae bacterium]|nr:EpsI family protein [Bryobacteraceae bacterium]
MENRRLSEAGFLRSRAAVVLSVLLLTQAALLYGFNRRELLPTHVPLAESPRSYGSWASSEDNVVEKEVQAVLRADDLLNRTFVSYNLQRSANLFVAYFRSQRTGQAPHAPKNCLPGSGWVPVTSDIINVAVPGRPEPLEVNRYIVQKGDVRSMVMYWYQSRDRVVASEYTAKFYVIADAIRYNRTDTALVRVVVPLQQGEQVEEAQRDAEDFIRNFYHPLRGHFPKA